MKVKGQMMITTVVAVLSFAAGRIDFPAASGSIASAQETHDDPATELTPEMRAMLEFGTPGKHHRVLDRLIGEFSGEFTIRSGPDEPGVTTRGTVRREWILGGRFVREIVTAHNDLGVFDGVGYIGYDNFDGQYEMVWMDTTSTGIQLDTGTYHPDDQVMHVRESRRDPASGRLVNAWSKLDLSDPDRHVAIGYATNLDGRTFKAMEGILERDD